MPAAGQVDEATLGDVLRAAWRLKSWLVAWIAATLAGGGAYILLATPVYKATVLVQVVTASGNGELTDLLPKLGGLAGLAGVSLGRGGGSVEPIAVLKSRSLADEFIQKNNLRPLLFPEFWNGATAKWTEKNPQGPTSGQAVRRLTREVRRIEEDVATGLVRVEFRWRNPALAAEWANSYIELANRRLQQRAMDDAAKRLKYLNEELAKSPDVQLKEAIYQLMQSEINTAMLASVRKDFAFTILDPAVAADEDDVAWPRAAPLVAVAIVLGLILGLLSAVSMNHSALRLGSAGAGSTTPTG